MAVRFFVIALIGWACRAAWASEAGSDFALVPEQGFATVGYPRGTFQPGRATYGLTNLSLEPLVWRASTDQNWISVYPYEGDLEPATGTNLTLFPNNVAFELETNLYSASLVLSNVQSGAALIREVSLAMVWPAEADVDVLLVPLSRRWQLEYTGLPGSVGVVEISDDFAHWTPWVTNVLIGQSVRNDLDLTVPRQFYRVWSEGEDVVPAWLTLTNAVFEEYEQLRVTGEIGAAYLVEGSLDGLEWTVLSTNRIPDASGAHFTNPWGDMGSGAVYRAQSSGLLELQPLHHIHIIGQSLAVGIGGQPALSTTPLEEHYRMFSDGVTVSFTNLYELGLETMATSVGRHLTDHSPGHRLLLSNAGIPRAAYVELKKGTEPYYRGILQFRDGAPTAACAFLGYRPSAIFVVHGEGDHINPFYEQDIRQWQSDYETDIREVTGLREAHVPMFHSQASAWTSPGNGSAMFTLGAFKVLEESERNPDDTVLVCPKYMFPYSDGIHLTNSGYRWLGEYYAKAYRTVVVQGGVWTPLKPNQITRSNTLVKVQFHVPVPPLVLDTNMVSDPGHFGFAYLDNSGAPPSIESVEITGPDTVEILLNAVPTGGGERLGYAYSGIPGSWGGPTTGPRGNLRDSDPESSSVGNTLYNWCVHFNKAVEVLEENP